VLLLARLLYAVRVRGLENLQTSGGMLLVSNHISYIDALIIQLASPRRIRFVGYDRFPNHHSFFHFLFRLAGIIPISPSTPLLGTRSILKSLKAGELVCLFPEGGVSRTGQLLELKPGFELMARRAKVPVLPLAHDGLWGSIFSFAGNKYLWKSPRLLPTPVFVVFGKPVPPEQAHVPEIRKKLMDLGHEAFHERPVLKRNLAREAVRALAKRPWSVLIVDRTTERTEFSSAKILAASALLSRHIRRSIPERRVGVVLPPGAGATIANLAICCAGKIPVNLNFTAGRAALEASLRIGEVRTIITADQVRAKFPSFPWTEDTRDFRSEMAKAGGKRAILPWLLAAYLLPNQWFADLLGLSREGDEEEAVLLFTSGSSGEPKGVILSHRNILANCSQISSTSVLPSSGKLIACLPFFHSFGCTVTLWYPMLRGCRVISVPSPLDTKRIVDAIHEEQATVLVGAPTFIRPFLKRAESKELGSLELVVSGAEKLPLDLYQAFLHQFHIEILQGYGLTETSPVANVNQPNPPPSNFNPDFQLGKRLGAVGRLMPGMSARIMDADTGAELPLESTGILWLKGDNIFRQYLRDPEKTSAVFNDGWFVTGDLGRFDSDGFLYIEGRLSRFSKIGGEMVPHGTVEQKIIEGMGWEAAEKPLLAIVGVPDAAKGEQLVLVTTQDITLEQVREVLQKCGMPSLWVPRVIHRVENIPLLGSGKLDLKHCKVLAQAAADAGR
jgi:acyl-[acyl-carrier-protein]-phospholipid O-acyltransferase/long-chain-fatty-acid--[acyl-carrier-protein] ligase